jgi:hypothetical protein
MCSTRGGEELLATFGGLAAVDWADKGGALLLSDGQCRLLLD